MLGSLPAVIPFFYAFDGRISNMLVRIRLFIKVFFF